MTDRMKSAMEESEIDHRLDLKAKMAALAEEQQADDWKNHGQVGRDHPRLNRDPVSPRKTDIRCDPVRCCLAASLSG
jgi:hypothetical protein